MLAPKVCRSILGLVAVAGLVLAAAGPAAAAEKEAVQFRLKSWKTLEFEDASKAKAHADAVKKIGCEVTQENHGGHIDVTYRCPEWKQVAVRNHGEAHKWEKWLKDSGFETKHAH